MRMALPWTLPVPSTSLPKRGTQNRTQHPSRGPTSVTQRGRTTSLAPPVMHLWMQDKVRLALPTTSPHRQPMSIPEPAMAVGTGMVRVRQGLYLGGAEAGAAPGALEAAGVVALLSVDVEEPAPPPPGVRTLHVAARDEPGADLLSHLDACAAFLAAAQATGRAALVRCHAGRSRSAAVVAAYLMKSEGLRFPEAYAAVRAVRPEARMNAGFARQLELYEAMGCRVDATSGLYKCYRLQRLAQQHPASVPQMHIEVGLLQLAWRAVFLWPLGDSCLPDSQKSSRWNTSTACWWIPDCQNLNSWL